MTKVQRLTKSGLEKHWFDTANTFRSRNRTWTDVFWDLISEVSKVAMFLEGKKQLAQNCSFLLLAKGINHTLAMFSMAQRGLCTDAAQAARNAVETLLLLQLLVLDESEDLFRRWSEGEELKPGWVRNELKARSPLAVRNVIVTIDHESHDLNRSIYSWLSKITHANIDSLNHAARATGENSFEVFIGGSLDGSQKLLDTLFAVTCHGLHLTAIICMAVFDEALLQKNGAQWSSLERRIGDAVSS